MTDEERAAEELAGGGKTPEQIAADQRAAEQARQNDISAQLAELNRKLSASAASGTQVDQAAVRAQIEAIKQGTKFDDTQLRFIHQVAQESAAAAAAPANEAHGRTLAQGVLNDIDPALISQVEERMKGQPANIRANPEAWKSAAHMVVGENFGKIKTPSNGGGGSRDAQRSVVDPLARGGGSGGRSPAATGREKQYTLEEQHDRQLLADVHFEGDVKAMDAYASQGKTITRTAGKREDFQGSAADRELFRLTGGAAG